MKKLYLVGAIIVFLMILTLSLPQVGTTCAFYLIPTNSNPALVMFQSAGLGAVMGGLLVLFWRETGKSLSQEDGEDGEI